MSAEAAGSAEPPDRVTDPADHIIHVSHTPWGEQERTFVARLRDGDADELLGRVLLEHLHGGAPAEMRVPEAVPPSRMFHALSWIVQQGYALQVRERLEQTESQRRTGHTTRRRQWRLDPDAKPPVVEQPALF